MAAKDRGFRDLKSGSEYWISQRQMASLVFPAISAVLRLSSGYLWSLQRGLGWDRQSLLRAECFSWQLGQQAIDYVQQLRLESR